MHLKFGTCNPGKIKYGVLVRMVCEALDICSQGAEFGGHNFITFRQKLRPESSHLSSHFYNSVR